MKLNRAEQTVSEIEKHDALELITYHLFYKGSKYTYLSYLPVCMCVAVNVERYGFVIHFNL